MFHILLPKQISSLGTGSGPVPTSPPPELSRLLRGKANDPTKFWGDRVPPELNRLLRGKANDTTNF